MVARGATFLALALAVWCAPACSGAGVGADACRTIERARCARTATCEEWSEAREQECLVARDSQCRVGAARTVRAMSDEEIEACAEAIREAPCDALADVEAIAGCEALAGDAGVSSDAEVSSDASAQ